MRKENRYLKLSIGRWVYIGGVCTLFFKEGEVNRQTNSEYHLITYDSMIND